MKLNNQLNKKHLRKKNLKRKSFFEQGFTFLEFIIVVSLLGLTARLIIPPLKTSLNKSKQKEIRKEYPQKISEAEPKNVGG